MINKIFAIIFFLCTGISLFGIAGFYEEVEGGIIVPSMTKSIRLNEADIKIWIELTDKSREEVNFHFFCTYTLVNLENKMQNILVGFPLDQPMEHYRGDSTRYIQAIRNVKVYDHGAEKGPLYFIHGKSNRLPEIRSNYEVYGLRVSIKPLESKSIGISGTIRSSLMYSSPPQLVLLTARTWNPPVKKAVISVIFNYPCNIQKNKFGEYSSQSRIIENNRNRSVIVYSFTDFLPEKNMFLPYHRWDQYADYSALDPPPALADETYSLAWRDQIQDQRDEEINALFLKRVRGWIKGLKGIQDQTDFLVLLNEIGRVLRQLEHSPSINIEKEKKFLEDFIKQWLDDYFYNGKPMHYEMRSYLHTFAYYFDTNEYVKQVIIDLTARTKKKADQKDIIPLELAMNSSHQIPVSMTALYGWPHWETPDMVRKAYYSLANYYIRHNREKAETYYIEAFNYTLANSGNIVDPSSLLGADLESWEHEPGTEAPCYYIAYNLACCYALSQDKEKALQWLTIALRLNRNLKNSIIGDRDLSWLNTNFPDDFNKLLKGF